MATVTGPYDSWKKSLNFAVHALFSTGAELSEALLKLNMINSRRKSKKLAQALILQNAQNVVISRCFSVENGYEMYKDL